MNAFVFYVVLMMPGQQAPLFYLEPVANHEACVDAQREFVSSPIRQALVRGGHLQIGCTVTYVRSIEH